MEGTVLLHRASSTSCITLQSSFRGSLDRDYILAMKVDALSFALFAVLSLFGIADAGNNAGPPGTSAQHITYDCTGDPMGCQNMCYYHYCLGRSNYLYIGTVALLRISAKTQQTYGGKDKTGQKLKRDNRSGSGYRHKIFDKARRAIFGTQALTVGHTTPDEYPPAAALEGGSGSSLVGHDKAYKVQGARMKAMWGVLGFNRGWIEPFN